MADGVITIDPASSKVLTVDFEPYLPSADSTLSDVGSGSTIDAYEVSAGTDVGSTILSSKTRTSKTLTVKVGSLTLGKEYRLRFVGQGASSSQKFTRWLLVLARQDGELEI